MPQLDRPERLDNMLTDPNSQSGGVVLRGVEVDLTGIVGRQFVTDCTRAGEGLLSDDDLREKYELSAADWRNITKSTALIRAIQAERERRIRNGEAARESAAKIFAKAPEVLGT